MTSDGKPRFRQPGQYMNTAEVAAEFDVERNTPARWDRTGRLPSAYRTLGGHRRWRRSDVEAFKAKLEADALAEQTRYLAVLYGDR